MSAGDGIELALLEERDSSIVAQVIGDSDVEAHRKWVRILRGFYYGGKEIPCSISVCDEVVGYIRLEIHDNKNGALHYGLIATHRGRGVATKVCNAMVRYAFETLGLRLLKIDPPAQNVPSCRVAERCGFEKVGTLEATDSDGSPLEIARYRMTETEWRWMQDARKR